MTVAKAKTDTTAQSTTTQTQPILQIPIPIAIQVQGEGDREGRRLGRWVWPCVGLSLFSSPSAFLVWGHQSKQQLIHWAKNGPYLERQLNKYYLRFCLAITFRSVSLFTPFLVKKKVLYLQFKFAV